MKTLKTHGGPARLAVAVLVAAALAGCRDTGGNRVLDPHDKACEPKRFYHGRRCNFTFEFVPGVAGAAAPDLRKEPQGVEEQKFGVEPRGPAVVAGNLLLIPRSSRLSAVWLTGEPAEAWQLTTASEYSLPAVHEGLVYVATGATSDRGPPRLHALEAGSGRWVWEAELDALASVPVVIADVVVVSTDAGSLVAIDRARGKVRWRHQVTVAGAVAVSGAAVVVASADGRLSAFDASSGVERWQTGDGRTTGPVSVRDGVAFVQRLQGGVLAVDAASGAEVWTAKGPFGLSELGVAVDDRHVYVPVERGVVALDRRTGRQAWSDIRKPCVPGPLLCRPPIAERPRAPLVVAGSVLLGTDPSTVVARDVASGNHLWEKVVGAPYDIRGITFGSGGLYVTTSLGLYLVH